MSDNNNNNIKFIFIRHGRGCHNEGIKVNDPPLTKQGIDNTKIKYTELKDILKENNINKIDILGSSPLVRSIETAYYASTVDPDLTNKKIFVFPHLRELDENTLHESYYNKKDKFSDSSIKRLDKYDAYRINSLDEQKEYFNQEGIINKLDFQFVENNEDIRKRPGDIPEFINYFLKMKNELDNPKIVLIVTHAGVLNDYILQYNEENNTEFYTGFSNNNGFMLNVNKNSFNNNKLPDPTYLFIEDVLYTKPTKKDLKRCNNKLKLEKKVQVGGDGEDKLKQDIEALENQAKQKIINAILKFFEEVVKTDNKYFREGDRIIFPDENIINIINENFKELVKLFEPLQNLTLTEFLQKEVLPPELKLFVKWLNTVKDKSDEISKYSNFYTDIKDIKLDANPYNYEYGDININVEKKIENYKNIEKSLTKIEDTLEKMRKIVDSNCEGNLNLQQKTFCATNTQEDSKNDVKKVDNYFQKLKETVNVTEKIDIELIKKIEENNIFKDKILPQKIVLYTKLDKSSKEWDNIKIEFSRNQNVLINLYEDLSGAVRVYVRIKKWEQDDVFTGKEGKIIKKGDKTYGPFYGIFNSNFDNINVYSGLTDTIKSPSEPLKVDISSIKEKDDTISPGLYQTFEQVKSGYSIVLFGYGLSGSGKTYTLIGSPENKVPGLLHYGLYNLGAKNIKLKNLFEHYVKDIDLFAKPVKFVGQIINLIGDFKTQLIPDKIFSLHSTVLLDESRGFNDYMGKDNNLGKDVELNENISKLYDFTIKLEEYRISKNRVTETPNNPSSSRSHLFMVFELIFEGNIKGYVTIVDMAGRESPEGLRNIFLKSLDELKTLYPEDKNIETDTKLPNLINETKGQPSLGVGAIERFKKDIIKTKNKEKYTADDVYRILREGFFINETINHLKYFFLRAAGKSDIKIDKQNLSDRNSYNQEKVYIEPKKEESGTGILGENKNFCGMIPILKCLDNLSKRKSVDSTQKDKPTKFIMMCMIRQEPRYLDDTIKTIIFADQVKST